MYANNIASSLELIQPIVVPFFEEDTNTYSYIVQDPTSDACAIIDPVLDFDLASGRLDHHSADAIIRYIEEHELKVEWIIETHVHADHLTAAAYLKEKLGGRIGIGEQVTLVQETFGKVFNAEPDFKLDGSQFDHLFKNEEQYSVGNLSATAIHTPGHTPACMVHVFGDAAFVGDTLFMPDAGTARADFPGGDASTLYHSIKKILAMPPKTRVFMCHDYGAEGRDEVSYETTVEAELASNIHVNEQVSEEEFVQMRESRDKVLDVPHLILPSLQVNMRAGHLPPAEANGKVYLKIPVNLLG